MNLSNYTLGQGVERKSNNLQLIKFLAAILVILSHAYALNGYNDLIAFLSREKLSGGMIAVAVFFLSGGILIAKSVEASKSTGDYLKKRCIRIFPLLGVVVFLSAFVLGPFFTSLSLKEYFTNAGTYKYLLNAILVLQHYLPGVFENNTALTTVNGSLWTLPVEFLCYIACLIVFKMKCLKKNRITILLALYLIFAGGFYFLSLQISALALLFSAIQPCYLFLLGMCLYTWRDYIILDIRLFLVAVAGFLSCFFIGAGVIGIWVFFPYVIVYLAFMEKQCSKNWAKLGNYSYAIYLCAFPLQQIFIHLWGGNMNYYLNMVLGCVSSCIIGWFLYEGIEKRL